MLGPFAREAGRRDGAAAARDIHAEIMADGTALAEVRVTDPRGYGSLSGRGGRQGVVTLSSLAGQAGTPPTRLRAVEVFGERGDKAGQFHYPTGLAVDGDGVLVRRRYLSPSNPADHSQRRRGCDRQPGNADAGSFCPRRALRPMRRIRFMCWSRATGASRSSRKEGVLALIFGRPGRGEGELQGPTAIAVAPGSGDIYLADTGNSRVQRFDYTGRFLNIIGGAARTRTGIQQPAGAGGRAGRQPFRRRYVCPASAAL